MAIELYDMSESAIPLDQFDAYGLDIDRWNSMGKI
jgi:hypothetical protein